MNAIIFLNLEIVILIVLIFFWHLALTVLCSDINSPLQWYSWGSWCDWGGSRGQLHLTVSFEGSWLKITIYPWVFIFLSLPKTSLFLIWSPTSFKTTRANGQAVNSVVFCFILTAKNTFPRVSYSAFYKTPNVLFQLSQFPLFNIVSLKINSLSTTGISASKRWCKNLFEMVTLSWGLSIASKACSHPNSFEIFNLNNKPPKYQHIQVVIS